MADDQQAAHGFGHAADDAQDLRGAGEVKPVHRLQHGQQLFAAGEVELVHRLDQRGVGPGLQRLQRLQGAAGGGHQHDIGRQAEFADGAAHGGGGGAARAIEGARVVGLGRIVPGGLRVAQQQ